MPEEVNSQENGSGGTGNGLVSTLTSKELLVPAALSAAGAIVAAKAPDLFNRLSDSAEEKGEDAAEGLGQRAAEGAKKGLAGGAISKVLPGGGGGSGGKKTRRLPIQRWTDVAVPVDKAYQAWTDFDKYPTFMHRVLSVERKDKDKVSWQEKIWFSKREWEGKITERRKNDRIVWKTTSGMSHKGVVSFHELDDNLTRVMVDMEFEPNGMMEKMASGLRFVKRAVQADLARFKAYVEMEDARGIEYRAAKEDDEEEQDERGSSDDSGNREQREQSRRERAGAGA